VQDFYVLFNRKTKNLQKGFAQNFSRSAHPAGKMPHFCRRALVKIFRQQRKPPPRFTIS